MNLEKLTQKSQEALQEAQTRALRLGNNEIEPEHMLVALLDELYVVPPLRGRGIGTAIVEVLVTTARQRAYDLVEINVDEGDVDARRFYERHGGAVVSMAVSLYAYGQASPRAQDLELVSLDHSSREIITPAHFARRMRPPILAQEFLTYQKAVAWHFGIERGRLAAASEIPPGVGLASSAAVSVASPIRRRWSPNAHRSPRLARVAARAASRAASRSNASTRVPT